MSSSNESILLAAFTSSAAGGDPVGRALEPWRRSVRIVPWEGGEPTTLDGIVTLGDEAPTVSDPLLPTIRCEDLRGDDARDHFFERAYGRHRLRNLFHPTWTIAELTAFNTRERHRVIAHDPKRHRLMGRLVSKPRDHSREDMAREIARLYAEALARPVTRRKHVHVLSHLVEILESGATTPQNELATDLAGFAQEGAPLWPLLVRIRSAALQQGMIGLANQSYLDPDPLERSLRFEMR